MDICHEYNATNMTPQEYRSSIPSFVTGTTEQDEHFEFGMYTNYKDDFKIVTVRTLHN